MIKTLNSSFIIIHKKISEQKHKTNVVVKKESRWPTWLKIAHKVTFHQ